MRRLWLFLLVLLLAGCATPEERIARALRPAIEQLPGVIRAIQEGSVSPPAGPTTRMSGCGGLAGSRCCPACSRWEWARRSVDSPKRGTT